MFDSKNPLRVEFINGHLWRLLEDFAYFDADYKPKGWYIDVPTGFVTDFASIPRLFWNILPPVGQYGKAAVIHDYLYMWGRNGQTPVTRGYADGVFRKAMANLGVGWTTRWLMYSAVRTFAGAAWAKRREVIP